MIYDWDNSLDAKKKEKEDVQEMLHKLDWEIDNLNDAVEFKIKHREIINKYLESLK